MKDHPEEEEIKAAIRDRYRQVSRSAEGFFRYATGMEGARALGYDEVDIAEASPELLSSFCGVGNPFVLGAIRTGERVLDIGCGVGFDLHVARRAVGGTGEVLGVDLTPEMVAVAGQHLERSGLGNVEVCQGASEELPVEADSIDVVISNGVFNLSPRKHRTFAEAFRVLRPGGRLQFADIILDDDLPGEITGSLEAWSN